MYILKTETHFDAAHFLAGYEGKCRNIHGHRWRVEAEIAAESLRTQAQERGMVIDFSLFRDVLTKIAKDYDHTLIYERGSLHAKTLSALRAEEFSLTEVAFRPTAENLARDFYERLAEQGMPVVRVAVYETPNNCAVYCEKGVVYCDEI